MKNAPKKKGKSMPPISTASLPDIIFMLLFFFMVTTVMRETDLLLKIDLPKASHVMRMEDKSLVDHLYIGPPMDLQKGTGPIIQLNGQYATVEEIKAWVEEGNARRKEPDVPRITRSLKVDDGTTMRIVTEVKQELRRNDALKICYSTAQAEEP